jgi:hypothetical protein
MSKYKRDFPEVNFQKPYRLIVNKEDHGIIWISDKEKIDKGYTGNKLIIEDSMRRKYCIARLVKIKERL